jgi:hypothetical protein
MKDYRPLVSSAPSRSILNARTFHYRNSVDTDIRKTFARVRREQARDGHTIEAESNVTLLGERGGHRRAVAQ